MVEVMVAKSVAELVAEVSERIAQMGNHGDCAHDSAPVQLTTGKSSLALRVRRPSPH